MVNVRIRTNAKQWQSAMKAWRKAKRGASHDDCINKFGSESCVKAISFTPKTKVGKINTYDPAKGGKTKKQKLLFALASQKGIKKGSGGQQVMYPYVNKEFSKRKRSIGANKAGFIKPAIQLGANLRLKPYGGGSASESKGIKSKRFKMRAFSFNEVDGAGIVGHGPMRRAMDFVVKKEHAWAIKRLQKANNKFSAKTF
jgi:hypothetical protein